jgi:Predicted permease
MSDTPESAGEAETSANVSGASVTEPRPALSLAASGPATGSLSQAWGRLAIGAKILILAIVLFGLGWLIAELGPVLTPFLFGAILAYIGLPAMTWLENRRLPRSVGAILVIVALVGALALLTLLVAPLVATQCKRSARRCQTSSTAHRRSGCPGSTNVWVSH